MRSEKEIEEKIKSFEQEAIVGLRKGNFSVPARITQGLKILHWVIEK